jgi:hypothetical protein
LLIYDWAEKYDFVEIIEDIENIDFTKYEKTQEKMTDWLLDRESDFNKNRRMFTNAKADFTTDFILPSYDVEGYNPSSEVDDIQQIVHAHLVRQKNLSTLNMLIIFLFQRLTNILIVILIREKSHSGKYYLLVVEIIE